MMSLTVEEQRQFESMGIRHHKPRYTCKEKHELVYVYLRKNKPHITHKRLNEIMFCEVCRKFYQGDKELFSF